MIPVEQLNVLVSLGTVSLQVGTVCLLIIFLLRRKNAICAEITDLVGRFGLVLALLLSSAATTMALYYSEVLGIVPCGLCWVQRIFLIPQIVLFALALFKREKLIADYVITLSAMGGIVALYQHYLQMGGTSVLPCPAVAEAVECSQRFLFEFGYITFPLVSFSAFATLIVLMLFVRNVRKN